MSPTELSKAADISVPYASQLIAGLRRPSLPVAIRIFDATGKRMGPLVGLSTEEVDAARKMARAA
jgi:hypothetical protein